MNQDQKIIEILHDFETFKLSEKEQGVYAHTISYKPYLERIKALLIHDVINCDPVLHNAAVKFSYKCGKCGRSEIIHVSDW